MKKTISAEVGGRNFIFDEDAYMLLDSYLNKFKTHLEIDTENDVMEELEMRIADLFSEGLHGKEVVDIRLTESIIAQLGLPGGEPFKMDESDSSDKKTTGPQNFFDFSFDRSKKLFRDPDEKKIGGVCSGMGFYFNIDPTIIRLVFVLIVMFGGAGIIAYVILLIVVPEASSAAEKCQMRGLEANADNIRKYSTKSTTNYQK
ncbi:MAG: PspC domain-containing protein [Bacteroidales bacterium]|nr:PspC domain-containing protein [Bacteroidales bacterium]